MAVAEDFDICKALQTKLTLEIPSSSVYYWKEDLAESKDTIRRSVWKKMEDKNQVDESTPSCIGKIPYFKGCNIAAKIAFTLAEFEDAKIVKVNPSLAQMQLRFLSLVNGKTLLVPGHADDSNFFYMLNSEGIQLPTKSANKCKGRKGAKRFGQALMDDWSKVGHIDVFVVGSVAVSTDGTRIGKGKGYAELEWGILWELGKVDQNTIVLTTVHDLQVVPVFTLNQSQSANYDLPVDIIVTPTRTIRIGNRQLKPHCGVVWERLTHEAMEWPIIQCLQEKKN